MEYVNRMGTPLEPALCFVHNALVGCNIRQHIKIIVSGKNVTGFDMVKNIALGADAVNSARAMMMSIGCIQSKQCNKNTCPVGVATQNPRLYRALDVDDKKKRAHRYHDATVRSFLELVGAMGFNDPDELTPRFIYRRISEDMVKTFNEIYDYLEPGALLNEESVPESYKRFWDNAKAEVFH